MFIRLWRSAISYEKKNPLYGKITYVHLLLWTHFRHQGQKIIPPGERSDILEHFYVCVFFLYDILFKLWHDLEYTPKNGIPFLIFSIIVILFGRKDQIFSTIPLTCLTLNIASNKHSTQIITDFMKSNILDVKL